MVNILQIIGAVSFRVTFTSVVGIVSGLQPFVYAFMVSSVVDRISSSLKVLKDI